MKYSISPLKYIAGGFFPCLLLLLFSQHTLWGQHFNYHEDYEKVLQRTKNPKDALYYPSLLSRFERNDTTITMSQMLGLMIGYTGQENFRPYEDLKTEKIIYELNNKEQYGAAIRASDTFLAEHPLNQLALIEKAYAYHKLNNEDSSAYFKAQFAGIMAAMDWSGDGRTPDHAMFSIGPQDGRNFIDKYYHADLGLMASAEDSHGNFCDKLEMKYKKSGKTGTVILFFAIQHAVNTTAPAAAGK